MAPFSGYIISTQFVCEGWIVSLAASPGPKPPAGIIATIPSQLRPQWDYSAWKYICEETLNCESPRFKWQIDALNVVYLCL